MCSEQNTYYYNQQNDLTNYSDFSDIESSEQQLQNIKKQQGSNEPEEIDITAYEIFTSDKDKQTQNFLDCNIQKNSGIRAKSTKVIDDQKETTQENEQIKMYKAKKDVVKGDDENDTMSHIQSLDLTPDQKLQYEQYQSQFPAMAKVQLSSIKTQQAIKKNGIPGLY